MEDHPDLPPPTDPRYQLLRDKLDRLRQLQESTAVLDSDGNGSRGPDRSGFGDRVFIEVRPAQDRSQKS